LKNASIHSKLPFARFSLATWLLFSSILSAQETSEDQHPNNQQSVDLLEISLHELMNVKVNTATKFNQEATKAPAIVSVILSDDIELWGYQSVADALKQVPGLYGLNDYLGYNYGVRGINAGQNAYSRIFKVMINGVPVPFRADSTNFLGPELIPIGIVERIEVVRGPGSALYGENAFMGIINIITKDAKKNQTKLGLQLGKNDYINTSVTVGIQSENWSINLAANTLNEHYDGLQLPQVSPKFNTFSETSSDNTHIQPQSLYADWRYQQDELTHNLMLSYSHLDTVAEFLDFGALSHENRVSLNKFHSHYKLNWNYSQYSQWRTSVGYSHGEPSSDERLSLGQATSFPKREFEFDVIDFSTEWHTQTNRKSAYIFGLDYAYDDETLIQIKTVDSVSGNETLLTAPSRKYTLKNIGGYAQYIKNLDDNTLLTLNLRRDEHNLYGSNTNYRVGLVKAFSRTLTTKFLIGSSFKAPAAMQLYALPLYPGGVIGNPELLVEEAVTLETEISWFAASNLALTVNLWLNEIDNKVELLPTGANVQPVNSGKQEGAGVETELKWLVGSHAFIANLAYQNTDNKTETLFQGTLVSPTAMYPQLTGYLRYQYQINDDERVGLAWQYASERRASNSNIRENLLQPYQLDEYSQFRVSYAKQLNRFALHINLDNLFDEDYAEPGFQGIDIPGAPRTWRIGISYEF